MLVCGAMYTCPIPFWGRMLVLGSSPLRSPLNIHGHKGCQDKVIKLKWHHHSMIQPNVTNPRHAVSASSAITSPSANAVRRSPDVPMHRQGCPSSANLYRWCATSTKPSIIPSTHPRPWRHISSVLGACHCRTSESLIESRHTRLSASAVY